MLAVHRCEGDHDAFGVYPDIAGSHAAVALMTSRSPYPPNVGERLRATFRPRFEGLTVRFRRL
jgi:hypothetical protein